MQFYKKGLVEIVYSKKEDDAVKKAIESLKSDFYKVLESRVGLNPIDDESVPLTFGVQNGTAVLDEETVFFAPYSIKRVFVATKENAHILSIDPKVVDILPGQKEGLLICVKGDSLFLLGEDRRGTIYAIYEFTKRMGVSPWHFFGDVPAKRKDLYELKEGYSFSDYPTVEYRGIFINDEEELEKWVSAYMQEATIGPKTYEYIFELLLRLKCNYIWPAMHVNSFNANVENGRLAEKMGIVVGTSHCDMLMRSNNREWEPWKRKKGYKDVKYDFSIEGENRDKLIEYWRESVEQNKDFEVTYTLGMRGIHDSGFVTKAFDSLSGKELMDAKIKLLEDVFSTQTDILKNVPHKEALRIFVPYKEVLPLYDNGLKVPEDVTLIWTNDNYGHVRRYPSDEAKKRSGGNGIYYHNSYWAAPGESYLFISSIPFAQTKNELTKAYENGITKLWVTNFGAIKPLEMHMHYYVDLAWNVGKENDPTKNVCEYLSGWLKDTFSVDDGKDFANDLLLFDQVVNTRKLELMEDDVFLQTEECDEAAGRIHFLKSVFERANNIYETLPVYEKDAFFELVLFRVHAAYYSNCMQYYADRSALMASLNRDSDAERMYRQALSYDKARQALFYYYNHVCAGGKWNGIVTPEDFPPPRTAMYPAAVPGKGTLKAMGVTADVTLPKNINEDFSNLTTLEAMDYDRVKNADGFYEIPYLGRGGGLLLQVEDKAVTLEYTVNVNATGDYSITIERFPSLDSVGEIGLDISVDDRFLLRAVTQANDEHRGTWRTNILNDVDLMTVSLGTLTEGAHKITLGGFSRYFAFSRLHVYTGKMFRNHVLRRKGVNELLDLTTEPEVVDLDRINEEIYRGVEGKERTELAMPLFFGKNNVLNDDIYGFDMHKLKDVIVVSGAQLLNEAYYAGNADIPDYCVGLGRDALSLYYRDPFTFANDFTDKGKLPRPLSHTINVTEPGKYYVYACLFSKADSYYRFKLCVDEDVLCDYDNARLLWKYSSENAYKWVPIGSATLIEGNHHLTFGFGTSKLRLEGIMLVGSISDRPYMDLRSLLRCRVDQ